MIKRNYFFTAVLLSSTFLIHSTFANDITDFSDFQNAVTTGGEYTLTENITADSTLGTISGSLSIDGNGYSIEGNNTFNGIVVEADADLNLKNIGSTETDTGLSGFSYVIDNSGNTAVDNVIFSNNVTSDNTKILGGIIKNAGTLSVKNSIFDNNTASSSYVLWGGVIENGQDQTAPDAYISEISNSIFKNNTSSTISPSTAAPHGAIILNWAHIGTISGNTFENNTMYGAEDSWGGAHGVVIDNNESGIIDLITDSKFINNKTYRVGDTEYTDGRNYHASAGAIDNYNIIGTIQNSLFEGNSAESVVSSTNGGAIMNVRTPDSETSQGIIDKIDNNVFKNNYAKNSGPENANGGAISQGGILNYLTNNMFESNYVSTVNSQAIGGGMTNRDIKVMSNNTFTQNYTYSENAIAAGGAISHNGTIETFYNNTFNGNHTQSVSSSALGGAMAINSKALISDFSGNIFSENYANSTTGSSQGGAIYIASGTSNIERITNSQFSDNYTQSGGTNGTARGGAMLNGGTIGLIENSSFDNNYAQSTYYGRGGAIYNGKTINNIIKTTFLNNSAIGNSAQGGAIYLYSTSNIENMESVIFKGNSSISENAQGAGGAIVNNGSIGQIVDSQISENYSQSGGENSTSVGGAIVNAGAIDLIENTSFSGNYTQALTLAGRGGAIYNVGTIGDIVNTNFINNSVIGNEDSTGGAIHSTKDINITAQNAESVFSGNNVNGKGNDIYMSGAESSEISLNLKTDNGSIYMDGGIDGNYYNINISGSGTMNLAAAIENANSVTVDGVEFKLIEGTQGRGSIENENGTSLSLNNTTLNLNNGYQDKLALRGYSSTASTLHIDVDPAAMSADTIEINGDVNGTTNIIIHASDNSDIRGKGEILFAQSQNDTTGNENSFALARVFGSPYMYDVLYANLGENSNSWSFEMNDTKNPDYDERLVAPEVIAYIGLNSAGLEQVKDLRQTVFKKSSAYKSTDYAENIDQRYNLWIDASYVTSTSDKPVELDGDIWGVTAGGNIQQDIHNQLGIFAAYRQGEYDMNGKGQRFYAKSGSEIDIDSYLAGVYYRYDNNGWYGFATIYGGLQKADLNSKDGIIKTDSDGTIFTAGIEGGKRYTLHDNFLIEPSLGIYYTSSDFDNIRDNGGKRVEYNTLSQFEIEAGIGFEYNFSFHDMNSLVYIKPSVIQTITEGDSVKISQLPKTSVYHDQTLGRIELGGKFAITDQLSGYGWANYTYGSSYDATSLGLGLDYNF